MGHGAAALAGAGMLDTYFAPLATTQAEENRLFRLAPARIAERLGNELRRRQVPEAVPAPALKRLASAPELACVVAKRLGAPDGLTRALAARRDAWFDRAVSRRLESRHDAAHLAYGAAQNTLRAAGSLGIATYLEHPVHHHAFAERILQEEARLQPEWASTLQFHRPSEQRKRRINAEIALTDRVMVLSSFSQRTFLEAGVAEEKIVVTQPGVDSELFSPGPRSDEEFRVLFVGVFTQRKGLSYLVDGFEHAAIPRSELLLVGAPWGTSVPLQNRPHVRLANWHRNADLPHVYRSADVLVLPSLEEGFGRVVLEALACGVPAIVTPNTGAADVIDEGVNGYVVPIRDADAIAERLLELHRDPNLRAAMSRAARERAQQHSWLDYGQRLVDAIVART